MTAVAGHQQGRQVEPAIFGRRRMPRVACIGSCRRPRNGVCCRGRVQRTPVAGRKNQSCQGKCAPCISHRQIASRSDGWGPPSVLIRLWTPIVSPDRLSVKQMRGAFGAAITMRRRKLHNGISRGAYHPLVFWPQAGCVPRCSCRRCHRAQAPDRRRRAAYYVHQVSSLS